MINKQIYLPIKDYSTPREGHFKIYCDMWWLVTPDNCIVINHLFKPYCSSDKNVLKSCCKIFENLTGYTYEKIPVIYLPITGECELDTMELQDRCEHNWVKINDGICYYTCPAKYNYVCTKCRKTEKREDPNEEGIPTKIVF